MSSRVHKRESYSHLFGPVPSRRLGRSLGVDLVPLKTCSFDCVFCQVGKTDCLTSERREYVDTEEVKKEIGSWMASGDTADFITLSGSGEPTLHTSFGEIIEYVKEHAIISVALLTNGSLLHVAEVRSAALKADLVKVSLSAWNAGSMAAVNRPVDGLDFETIYNGILRFSRDFPGELWLEVFLVEGINDEPDQVKHIAEYVNALDVDVIHLNTVVRPPSETWARAPKQEVIEAVSEFFDPKAEPVFERTWEPSDNEWQDREDQILNMIARRPCTSEDIAVMGRMHPNEVAKYMTDMFRKGIVSTQDRDGRVYYYITGAEHKKVSDAKDS